MSGQSLDPRHQFLAQVPFFACRDVSVPGTVGDLVSHAHVRVAFLNELLPREGEELFHDWEARTGLEGKVRKWKEARDWGLSLKSGDPDYDSVLNNYEAAARDWGGAMWSAREFFLCDAWRFQRQLGSSWSWLSEELAEQFFFWMIRQISGWTQKSMLVHFIPHAPVASLMKLEFSTRDGEPVDEALQRFDQEVHTARQQLLSTVPSRGRVPHQVSALQRNASWFYRHKVRGESIRAIALKDFTDQQRRKDVREGIRRAEQLLSLLP